MEQSGEPIDEPLAMPSCKNCGHRQTRHITAGNEQLKTSPCEACDCKAYEPMTLKEYGDYDPAKDPLNDPSSPQSIERNLFPAVKKWAHSYDGYQRFASENWNELLEPLWTSLKGEREIPGWVGVDLLRAWAFYMARAHNWSCMNETYYTCHQVIYAIAYAVQNHEAATQADLPPRIPESFREIGRRR